MLMLHFEEKCLAALVVISLPRHKEKWKKSSLATRDYTLYTIFHSKTLATVLLASST